MATSQKSRFAAPAATANATVAPIAERPVHVLLAAASKRPVGQWSMRVETNRMHPVYRLGDHALGVVCRSAKAGGEYVMAIGTGKARRLRLPRTLSGQSAPASQVPPFVS